MGGSKFLVGSLTVTEREGWECVKLRRASYKNINSKENTLTKKLMNANVEAPIIMG